ncbi:sodium/hydrogen antiporter [Leptospira ryugenii]|uniref:Sodium/hydrogen antiporter n=1 Tax=Leptospira ryugenii TaxID=1917863 RepID=A0A2P2E293_9LEPT|nr:potassium/proton antiporter [Leptospira ryugenii]GBF50954.1 sodium/hydrogen antiporter [Leptospira ryugenii]
MDPIDQFTLQAFVYSALILFSILSSKLFFRFGFPILLIFLTFGMLAGTDGFGGIEFSDYGLAQSIGVFALMYILFLGGLESDWDAIKSTLSISMKLSILGTIITALVLGLFIHLLFPVLGFLESFLLGSIVSATDAASVFNIFKTGGSNLQEHIKKIIEFESGSNDAIGVLLTSVFLSLITSEGTNHTGWYFVRFFFFQVMIGVLMGYGLGMVFLYLMNTVKLGYDGLYLVFITASVPFIYAVTTMFQGNGFLAVYLAGILIGRFPFIHKKSIFRFLNGYVWILQIGMFLCFGLLVFPSRLDNLWLPGLTIAVLLILVARPIAVFLSLWREPVTLKEKLFISWVGLRGASPIILATFPVAQGVAGAEILFHVVFFVVLVSLLLQGSTIQKMAEYLGLLQTKSDKLFQPKDFDNMEFPGMSLQEFIIPYNSHVVEKALYEINLPKDSHILLIARGEQYLIPSGNTTVKGGDVIWILAKDEVLPHVGRTLMH